MGNIDWTKLVTREQREADALEAAWATMREERDRRLTATDFTQMADWPNDPAPWREYRQALRDLPAATVDPANPVWPHAPTA